MLHHRPQAPLAPGDIVLTAGIRGKSAINAHFQRAVRKRYIPTSLNTRQFWPSHAALVVQPLVLVHSMTGVGVHFDSLLDLLAPRTPKEVLGIRHPLLEADERVWLNITERSNYYLEQAYNYVIGRRKSGHDRSSFCSELIHKIFTDVGIAMPRPIAQKILPIDFLIWAEENGWAIFEGNQILNRYQADLSINRDWARREAALHSNMTKVLVRSAKNHRQVERSVIESLALMTEMLEQAESGRLTLGTERKPEPLSGGDVYEAALAFLEEPAEERAEEIHGAVSGRLPRHWTMSHYIKVKVFRAGKNNSIEQ